MFHYAKYPVAPFRAILAFEVVTLSYHLHIKTICSRLLPGEPFTEPDRSIRLH